MEQHIHTVSAGRVTVSLSSLSDVMGPVKCSDYFVNTAQVTWWCVTVTLSGFLLLISNQLRGKGLSSMSVEPLQSCVQLFTDGA